jgi:phosphoglycerate dehydrogenase-like enzyme
MIRVLLTTTSFQDTPGTHHELLQKAGYEVVPERGPLPEARMLELSGQFDAFLCGDDAITRAVIQKSLPRLRVISKYGIGLDKIDVKSATEFKIPVLFTPGVNHTTVAEHTFCLLLAAVRHLIPEANYVAKGQWKRLTGHEILGKTIGIVGLGRIGKEVAIRARAFGLAIIGYDIYWPDMLTTELGVKRYTDLNELLKASDIVSLHTNLTEETRHMINANTLKLLRKDAIILNCARGELVDTDAIVEALKANRIGSYCTDVLDVEPPPPNHPLLGLPNAIVTPHIGSRTYESVQRQATCAVENLTLFLSGKKPHAQANLN